MPQRTPSCQLGAAPAPDSRLISPHPDGTPCHQTEHTNDTQGQWTPVRGEAAQSIEHTASRRSGPRKWRRAVAWLIAAGLHPKANATTQRIADDLADRMDYDTGHVRYCQDEMVARLGISKASLKRHISYLRELGALAWVQHGTRINIRRAMGLKGYAATATVYAAVIPAVYDHAMGHRIVGAGYGARIVIDQRVRQTYNETAQTYADPVVPVDNSPVENPGCEGLEPPSLTWVEEDGKLKMVGGSNYTSQARQPKTRIPHQRSEIDGRPRTAADVKKASKTVRLVRAMVGWTQSVPLRKLEFELRPFTDRGLDAYQIAADLNGMCTGMRWRPTNPVAFLRARLAADAERRQQIQAEQAAAERYELENPTPGAFTVTPAFAVFQAAHNEGLRRYQQAMRLRGHDDLSYGESADWDAAADIAAFLGSPA